LSLSFFEGQNPYYTFDATPKLKSTGRFSSFVMSAFAEGRQKYKAQREVNYSMIFFFIQLNSVPCESEVIDNCHHRKATLPAQKNTHLFCWIQLYPAGYLHSYPSLQTSCRYRSRYLSGAAPIAAFCRVHQ